MAEREAAYGISQNDYTGIIGLGLSVGLGYALAQGADGKGVQQRAASTQLTGGPDAGPAVPQLSGLSTAARVASVVTDMAGFVWNLPNTLFGLAYGLIGVPTGGIGFEHGQLQFKGNLLQWLLSFGGNGAITLGDAGIYPPGFGAETVTNQATGVTLGLEESLHSVQGRILGPFYLPAHVTFGTAATLVNFSWHGPVNVLEVGPHGSPPAVGFQKQGTLRATVFQKHAPL